MRIRIVPVACALLGLLGGTLPFLHKGSAIAAGMRRPVQAQQRETGPVVLKPEVEALLKQSTAVYSAMKSYRHVAECLEKGRGPNGEINNSTSYVLALERPNKFCYKSEEARGSAAVSNGKTFINYRNDNAGEDPAHSHTYFTRVAAPATYKGINIVDDVTFRLGSYMVALMLQGDVLADAEISAGLANATLKPGVMDNGKKFDLLTVPFQGKPVDFYFDSATHLLHKTLNSDSDGEGGRKIEVHVTEILEDVQIDKPIPASVFEYTPPKTARLIVKAPSHLHSKGDTRIARSF